MDYIQNDLDLIRMASGENTKDEKVKKVPKKDKTSGKQGQGRVKSETSVKVKLKPGRKTLSPKQTASGKLNEKEKKGGRRMVGRPPKKPDTALGKIRLPSFKKANPSPEKTVTDATPVKRTMPTAKLSSAAKQSPPAKASPAASITPTTKPPSRGAPSKKRRVLDPDAIPIDGICFEEGARIEAVDHGQWYRARIVKVDHKKMDILVHFDGWGPRFDTWFPMTSSLIRGRTELDAKPDITKYESGEDVLAKWTDGNFYPATIMSIKDSGSCQVMYFDGMKKLLRPNLIKKMSEQEKETAMQAAQKLLLAPPVDPASPVSSDPANPATSSSEFRKYRTSANDRERRIAARSGGVTPNTTPKAASGKKRGRKRKAPPSTESKLPKPESDVGISRGQSLPESDDTPYSKKPTSDDDAFIAKKARLDKITSDLVNKVSPVSDKSKEEVSTTNDNVTDIEFSIRSSSPAGSLKDIEMSTPTESGRKSPVLVSNHSVQRGILNKRKSPTQVQPEKLTDQNKSTKSEEMKTRSNETSNKSESVSTSNKQSESSDNITAISFKVGDTVLAKWADCRSYLAYIMEKESHDQYKIRYYDGMVKIVKASFIHPWVGPLPDSLKSFKPKELVGRKQRSRSTDLKSAWSKVSTSSAASPKASGPRRRTISVARRTEVSPPPIRRRRQSESKETVVETNAFAIGEKVIAKWTDLRWYPATVVSRKDNEHYEVRYHDKFTKIVRDTWLNQWAPTFPSKPDDTPPDNASKKNEMSPEAVDPTGEVGKQTGELQASPPVAQDQEKGRKRFIFIPGSSVLARFTDGKNYPATVKECLADKYVVEFDNGVRATVKHSRLKPWNPLALPPISKYNKKILAMPQTAGDVISATQANLPTTLKVPKPVSDKDKPPLLWSSQSAKMPRQVVRGYDAYYSGLPKQNLDVERQLFACRVPGCTKRFRKEDMLRQHHKLYHQKRYKLRDQKSHPGPVRRRASKEDKTRRRVSADYNMLSQSLPPPMISGVDTKLTRPIEKHGDEKAITQEGDKMKVRGQSGNTPERVPHIDAISLPKPQALEEAPRRKRGRPARKKRPIVEEPVKAVEPPKVEKVGLPVDAAPPPPSGPEEEGETPATMIEDVIRCSCGSEEEEGVMIQCEGCFTWQHVACIGFSQKHEKIKNVDDQTDQMQNADQKEGNQKPAVDGDGYVCWVCKNPQNVRRSCKYMYNNDFLTKGKLPSLMNFTKSPEKIKSSTVDPSTLSSLLDEVTKMQEALHGIKQKIKLATSGDEDTLLRTWKDLDAVVVGQQSSDSVDKEKSHASTGVAMGHEDDKTKLASPQKSKVKTSDGKPALPRKLSGETHEAYVLRCRENLLNHIAELETELTRRVDLLTDYVTTLQSSSDEEEAQNANDLQKGLSVVQALLARC